MSVTALDIAWLAGLLDGEGYFGYRNGCPSVQLQMTDLDVVEHAAAIMGAHMHSPKRNRGLTVKGTPYKTVYSCRVHGSAAIGVMQTVYALMGIRRRARIDEILQAWSTSTYAPRVRGETRFATCHPDRKMSAKGLCKPCYMAKWHLGHEA